MYNQPGPAFVGSRTLPVSGVQTSQVSMMQSSPQNIMQGPIMRGPVGQVPQAMPYPVNGNVINRPVMANTVPIAGPRPMPIVPPTVIQRPLLMPQALQINPIRIDDQVQVYCPVCKRAYSNF
jgi:hypothetical protein